MEVPDVLVSGRLVALTGRHAVAAVDGLQCDGDLSSHVHQRPAQLYRELVDVLDVLIRDDEDVAGVLRPPMARDERRHVVGSEHDLGLSGTAALLHVHVDALGRDGGCQPNAPLRGALGRAERVGPGQTFVRDSPSPKRGDRLTLLASELPETAMLRSSPDREAGPVRPGRQETIRCAVLLPCRPRLPRAALFVSFRKPTAGTAIRCARLDA